MIFLALLVSLTAQAQTQTQTQTQETNPYKFHFLIDTNAFGQGNPSSTEQLYSANQKHKAQLSRYVTSPGIKGCMRLGEKMLQFAKTKQKIVAPESCKTVKVTDYSQINPRGVTVAIVKSDKNTPSETVYKCNVWVATPGSAYISESSPESVSISSGGDKAIEIESDAFAADGTLKGEDDFIKKGQDVVNKQYAKVESELKDVCAFAALTSKIIDSSDRGTRKEINPPKRSNPKDLKANEG